MKIYTFVLTKNNKIILIRSFKSSKRAMEVLKAETKYVPDLMKVNSMLYYSILKDLSVEVYQVLEHDYEV